MRGGAVGYERAIGALQRARHKGIFLALLAAEIEAQVLAHLRIGIGNAVLVVLGGNQRQRIGLIAVFLEIEAGDLAENAGEAARNVSFLTYIGRLEQVPTDLGRRRRRHLL